MVALGTASAEQGAPAPLPCIHLKGAQLLPALALAGPVATTTSGAASAFVLHVLPAAAGGGGRRGGAQLAAALHCRSHGRLVGTAVSVRRAPADGEQAAAARQEEEEEEEEEEEGWEEEEQEEQWQCGDDCLESDGEEEAAAEGRPTVLEAWAPEAAKPECWGLYEFELSSGAAAGLGWAWAGK